jgi:hypothetical protein
MRVHRAFLGLARTPEHRPCHLLAVPSTCWDGNMSAPAASPGSPQTSDASSLARRVALELALPLAEILLEPLANLTAARLTARLEDKDSSVTGGGAAPTTTENCPRFVDARTVAATLGVDVKSVYRHSASLDAVRVGRRLRFDLDRALRSWSDGANDRCHSEKSQPRRSPVEKRSSTTRQDPPDNTHCRLLPIGRGNRSE